MVLLEIDENTLAAEIVDAATALAEEAASAAPQPGIQEVRERLAEDVAIHAALSGKAIDCTLIAGKKTGGPKPTGWHIDDRPNIPNLPDGIQVSFGVTPGETPEWTHSIVRILLEANEDVSEERNLAYLGYEDARTPITFTPHTPRGLFLEEEEHMSGVVDVSSVETTHDGSIPDTLPAMDARSIDFSIIERAVEIVGLGELRAQIAR